MKTFKILFAAVIIAGFATTGFAQDTDDATIGASAEIFRVLTIDDEEDLDFGVIFIGDVATLNPQDNTRDNVGGLGTTESFGLFSIAGNPDASFTVKLPGDVTLNHEDGAATGTILVSLADFYGYATVGGTAYDAANVTAIADSESVELNSEGDGYIWVGGEIDLSDDEPANGVYDGTIQVTVDYDNV